MYIFIIQHVRNTEHLFWEHF